MTDGEEPMRDLEWFDGPEEDDADTDTGRRRRRILLGLAAIPWLVVAAVLVTPLGAAAPASDATSDTPTTQEAPRPPTPQAGAPQPEGGQQLDGASATDALSDADAAADTDAVPLVTAPAQADDAGVGQVLELTELRGRWRLAPGEEVLASTAVVLARAHLTGMGPLLAVEDAAPATTSYAEHLVVEAVEHPSEDTAVVTVLAVVLVDPTDEPSRVELRRLAVPLLTGGDPPAAGGPPWELPPPALPSTPTIELTAVDDAALRTAADAALALAGLGAQRTVRLETAPGWPIVATTVDADEQEHTVWLRRHLDGLVVAGSTLAGDAEREERS